jgi:hypothetical protein
LRRSRKRALNSAPRKRGAPPGNKNALKHGKRTRERRTLLAAIRAHIQRGRALLAGGTQGAKAWA